MDNIVCMYACPSTEFRPQPFEPPNIITVNTTNFTLDDYKKKFIDLFLEMEYNFGKCKHLSIESDIDTGETNIDIIF